jgi:FkbM family methyltransferase
MTKPIESIKKAVRQALTLGRRSMLKVLPEDTSIPYEGFRLFYNRGNMLVARFRREGVFEPELVDALAKHLSKVPAPILLDVGANLGFISLALLRRLPQLKIIAVEPGPKQFAYLSRTITRNNLSDRIKVVNAALSDKEGTIDFYIHEGGDQAKDGIADTGRGERTHKITVPCLTLNSLLASHNNTRPTTIKIDTEGAELLVLRGATETLSNSALTVFFELEASNLKAYPYSPTDVAAFIHKAGFTIQTLAGQPVEQGDIEEAMLTTDTFVASHKNN